MSRPPKAGIAGPMAVVTIDGSHRLLPLADATRVVQLLGGSLPLDRRYGPELGKRWTLSSKERYTSIEMEIVDGASIAPAITEAPPPAPRALRHIK